MTNEQAKLALEKEVPVLFNGVVYVKITGLIYRKGPIGFVASAEILDKTRNCTLIVPIDRLAEAGKISEETLKEAEEFAEIKEHIYYLEEKMSCLSTAALRGKEEQTEQALNDMLESLLAFREHRENNKR